MAEYVNGAKQFLVRAVEKSSGKDLGSLALDYNKWYPRLPAELKCIARVPVFTYCTGHDEGSAVRPIRDQVLYAEKLVGYRLDFEP